MNLNLGNIEIYQTERNAYSKIISWLKQKDTCPNPTSLTPETVTNLMKASGVEREQLKFIWKSCITSTVDVTSKEIFAVLKLLYVAQQKLALTIESIGSVSGVPYLGDFFQNFSSDQTGSNIRESLLHSRVSKQRDSINLNSSIESESAIHPADLAKFEDQVNKSRALRQGKLQKESWNQFSSKISPSAAASIWYLLDVEGTGELTRGQLILALSLIKSYAETGEVPSKLDSSDRHFLQTYQPPTASYRSIPRESSVLGQSDLRRSSRFVTATEVKEKPQVISPRTFVELSAKFSTHVTKIKAVETQLSALQLISSSCYSQVQESKKVIESVLITAEQDRKSLESVYSQLKNMLSSYQKRNEQRAALIKEKNEMFSLLEQLEARIQSSQNPNKIKEKNGEQNPLPKSESDFVSNDLSPKQLSDNLSESHQPEPENSNEVKVGDKSSDFAKNNDDFKSPSELTTNKEETRFSETVDNQTCTTVAVRAEDNSSFSIKVTAIDETSKPPMTGEIIVSEVALEENESNLNYKTNKNELIEELPQENILHSEVSSNANKDENKPIQVEINNREQKIEILQSSKPNSSEGQTTSVENMNSTNQMTNNVITSDGKEGDKECTPFDSPFQKNEISCNLNSTEIPKNEELCSSNQKAEESESKILKIEEIEENVIESLPIDQQNQQVSTGKEKEKNNLVENQNNAIIQSRRGTMESAKNQTKHIRYISSGTDRFSNEEELPIHPKKKMSQNNQSSLSDEDRSSDNKKEGLEIGSEEIIEEDRIDIESDTNFLQLKDASLINNINLIEVESTPRSQTQQKSEANLEQQRPSEMEVYLRMAKEFSFKNTRLSPGASNQDNIFWVENSPKPKTSIQNTQIGFHDLKLTEAEVVKPVITSIQTEENLATPKDNGNVGVKAMDKASDDKDASEEKNKKAVDSNQDDHISSINQELSKLEKLYPKEDFLKRKRDGTSSTNRSRIKEEKLLKSKAKDPPLINEAESESKPSFLLNVFETPNDQLLDKTPDLSSRLKQNLEESAFSLETPDRFTQELFSSPDRSEKVDFTWTESLPNHFQRASTYDCPSKPKEVPPQMRSADKLDPAHKNQRLNQRASEQSPHFAKVKGDDFNSSIS